jgi:uncharacterized protein involved in exopolysaccharide biosynthesis
MTYLLTGTVQPPAPPAPAGPARPPEAGSLRDLCEVLFRHKFKMILFFMAVLAGAVYYLAGVQKTYTSESKILVRRGRENILLDPTVATGEVAPLFMEWESSMNSEIEILTSRELAAQAVRTIGPIRFLASPPPASAAGEQDDYAFSPREWIEKLKWKLAISPAPPDAATLAGDASVAKLAEAFSQALEVKMVPKSNIISISFESLDPALSRLVVETLLDLYHQMHILANRAPGAHEFFLTQTESLRAELEQAEDSLRDLKTRNGIASLEAQREILLTRIGDLQNQQELLAGQTAASRARVQAGLEAIRKESQSGSKVAPLPMNTYFKDNRQALQTEETTLAGLLAQADVLKDQLAQAQSEMKGLNENEIQIARLERSRDMLRDKFVKYSQNLEQTRIDQALQSAKISNISIIQPPTMPVDSNPTNRAMKLAMAFVVGLVGSVGIAFLAQHLDHTIKRPEEIEERLRVPALVSIPRLRARYLATAPGFPGVQSKRKLKGSFAFHDGRRYYAILRDRILALMQAPEPGDKPLVIGITSSHYGEGVSSVAANLAIAFAEGRKTDRVLLVDANQEQPSPHSLFGIKQAPGAAEIMLNEQGQLIIVEQNLYKVQSEDAEPPGMGGPVALYYDTLLRMVKERRYCCVVFDMPPLCDGSALPLARMMDGVVMVVKAEGVRGEIVMRMKDLLLEINARILGAVLNKRRFYIPGWLYRRL